MKWKKQRIVITLKKIPSKLKYIATLSKLFVTMLNVDAMESGAEVCRSKVDSPVQTYKAKPNLGIPLLHFLEFTLNFFLRTEILRSCCETVLS
jgi:hypothetical protein